MRFSRLDDDIATKMAERRTSSPYTRFRQHLGQQPTRKCPNTEKIERDTIFTLQGGPSGRGTRFVDIKFKVPSQYKLLIQKATSNLKSTKGGPRPDGNPVEEGGQKFPTWEGETKPQPNVLQHGLIVGCKKGMKIAGRGNMTESFVNRKPRLNYRLAQYQFKMFPERPSLLPRRTFLS